MNRLILIAMVVLMSSSTALGQDFCKGDHDYDGDCDSDDVTTFLADFGRSQYNNPCPPDGPAPVGKTGQSTCYEYVDPDWIEVDCEGTGQDGEYQKGVTWPNPRFTDNDDGTVTDNLTGLIWLKEANCFGGRTWNNALSDCNGLSAGWCGLTDGSQVGDWRLPNYKELFSLVDAENRSPALPTGHPFNNVQPVGYWSSTTLAYGNDSAWGVVMIVGNVGYDTKDFSSCVWPVRGGH